MYIKWFLKVLFDFIVGNLFFRLVSPLLALCIETREGPIDNNSGFGSEPRLWKSLWMCDTNDNSLLGDGAWKRMEAGHWEWRSKIKSVWLRDYMGRLGWLLRNSGYGLSYYMGATIDPEAKIEVTGDPFIQDSPKGKEGKCLVIITNPDGTKYFSYNSVKKLWVVSGVLRCWKWTLGWKLKTYAEDPSRLKTKPSAQIVCAPGIKAFK